MQIQLSQVENLLSSYAEKTGGYNRDELEQLAANIRGLEQARAESSTNTEFFLKLEEEVKLVREFTAKVESTAAHYQEKLRVIAEKEAMFDEIIMNSDNSNHHNLQVIGQHQEEVEIPV